MCVRIVLQKNNHGAAATFFFTWQKRRWLAVVVLLIQANIKTFHRYSVLQCQCQKTGGRGGPAPTESSSSSSSSIPPPLLGRPRGRPGQRRQPHARHRDKAKWLGFPAFFCRWAKRENHFKGISQPRDSKQAKYSLFPLLDNMHDFPTELLMYSSIFLKKVLFLV